MIMNQIWRCKVIEKKVAINQIYCEISNTNINSKDNEDEIINNNEDTINLQPKRIKC